LVPRVIFKGPAGTGKSLLAIELAKRAANQGRKVLLVCFNTLLAESLRRQYSHPLLEISTVDSLVYRIASLDTKNRFPSNPLDALKVINYDAIDIPSEYKVDQLIIDEAQDTLNERYLGFLDSLVTNGLSKGDWVAFGDFDAQRIYWNADNIDLVRKRFGDIPVAPLSKNCRNVVQIGHFVEGVLPKLPKWSEFLRDGEHPNPTLLIIPPNTDMVPLLDATISQFRKEHFALDEIVVLTPMEIPNPSQVFSESEYSEKFVSIESRKTGRVSFSTISKFKGLDSSCVIAMDLEQLKSWNARNELLYVLFTRATDRLAIMANEEARNMLISSLGNIN
jgi:DNA helicase IV